MRAGYAITRARNAGIQQRRGLLRGYAVARFTHMHVCGCAAAGVCAWARVCVCDVCVTA